MQRPGRALQTAPLPIAVQHGRPEPTPSRLEGRLARWAALANRNAVYYGAVLALILLALLVRLPYAFDEASMFRQHPDEATYFNKAHLEYTNDTLRHYPLPHGGSGFPFVLGLALDATGVPPSDITNTSLSVSQTNPQLHDGQREAAVVAYALNALLSTGVVVATFLLATQLLPRIGVLASMAWVAFDPFLLRQTGALLSEMGYTMLFVLALAAVVKARERIRWLMVAAALMAGAHMFRVNGLVMFVMVLAFAFVFLRGRASHFKRRHLAIAAAVFMVVATPYLVWRNEHLPGPFDYGTNQRYWTDNPWDLSRDADGAYNDPYWRSYSIEGGGSKESMVDYFRTHSFAEAFERLYRSVQWQVVDLVGGGGLAPTERHLQEGTALHPMLVVLCGVALTMFWRRREFWFLPMAAGFTLATFVWIYPVVRSVRYFLPLVPLAAIVAVVGLAYVAFRTRRPWTASAATMAAFLAVFAVLPMLRIGEGVAGLADSPEALRLTAASLAGLLVLAFYLPARDAVLARWHAWRGTAT